MDIYTFLHNEQCTGSKYFKEIMAAKDQRVRDKLFSEVQKALDSQLQEDSERTSFCDVPGNKPQETQCNMR